ncbi:hypothetical protein DFR56_101451 [Pseudogracilibacillus auburnensis]|uniref:Uncharacterized protein n=1 Tax=Pseudogracilibacillus auburnensis TaxID=1494959 RepID=A0A2V3WP98_9BACI|nr:hypothetical protein DFR56_101451 [Pseudogracilibacillus auburnensis]
MMVADKRNNVRGEMLVKSIEIMGLLMQKASLGIGSSN